MILPLTSEANFIEMVAHRLAEKFIRQLFLFSKEKNYSAYIGGLTEILDWSTEFCNQYYDNFMIEINLEEENDSNELTLMLDRLIIAFGLDRLRRFYIQHAMHSPGLIVSHAAIDV